MELVELPPDFIALAARELEAPQAMAERVLKAFVLERLWQEQQAAPEPPKISEK